MRRVTTRLYSLWHVSRHVPTARVSGYACGIRPCALGYVLRAYASRHAYSQSLHRLLTQFVHIFKTIAFSRICEGHRLPIHLQANKPEARSVCAIDA